MKSIATKKIKELMSIAEYAVNNSDVFIDIQEYPLIRYKIVPVSYPSAESVEWKTTDIQSLMQEAQDIFNVLEVELYA